MIGLYFDRQIRSSTSTLQEESWPRHLVYTAVGRLILGLVPDASHIWNNHLDIIWRICCWLGSFMENIYLRWRQFSCFPEEPVPNFNWENRLMTWKFMHKLMTCWWVFDLSSPRWNSELIPQWGIDCHHLYDNPSMLKQFTYVSDVETHTI